MTMAALDALRLRIVEVARTIATAHRCEVIDIKFMPDPFHPTVNDIDLWQWLGSPEGGIKGSIDAPSMHWNMNPTMGGEDFSFYGEHVPGAFMYLGQGSEMGKLEFDVYDEGNRIGANVAHFPTNTSLHSPRFNMDESVLHLGAALHTHLALRSLKALSSSSHAE